MVAMLYQKKQWRLFIEEERELLKQAPNAGPQQTARSAVLRTDLFSFSYVSLAQSVGIFVLFSFKQLGWGRERKKKAQAHGWTVDYHQVGINVDLS